MSTIKHLSIGENFSKGVRRIWLEGNALINAEFHVGRRYRRDYDERGNLLLVTDAQGKYKVSGKGEKPIIDISGGVIDRTFPRPQSSVKVAFSHGVITISEP